MENIDEQIAIKVMGWTWYDYFCPDCQIQHMGFYDKSDQDFPEGLLMFELGGWQPTRKIEQAFMALEHTGKDYIVGKKGKIYFCEIRERTYPVPMDATYKESRIKEEAICRAALAAEKA